jgi:predicted peptidase
MARTRVVGRGQGRTHGFLHRTYKDALGQESKYTVFVPHAYRGTAAFPLILFLHGRGESGSDGRKQARVGLGRAIRKQEKSFAFITVFPQSQHCTWEADSEDALRALAILELVAQAYRVDRKRISLTGISMGGFGTWSLALKYPERWAAIVPVCGGGDPGQAARIKDIPCWCFHGGADKVVAVEHSREMIAALRTAGGRPRYNEWARVGHNSWDRAYGMPELFTWLKRQRLP